MMSLWTVVKAVCEPENQPQNPPRNSPKKKHMHVRLCKCQWISCSLIAQVFQLAGATGMCWMWNMNQTNTLDEELNTQVAHRSAIGDSVAAPIPRHLPRGNLRCDTPFLELHRSYRALWGGVVRFSCDTPPIPGKQGATECSATVQRDRIAVAVGPLRSTLSLSEIWGPPECWIASVSYWSQGGHLGLGDRIGWPPFDQWDMLRQSRKIEERMFEAQWKDRAFLNLLLEGNTWFAPRVPVVFMISVAPVISANPALISLFVAVWVVFVIFIVFMMSVVFMKGNPNAMHSFSKPPTSEPFPSRSRGMGWQGTCMCEIRFLA